MSEIKSFLRDLEDPAQGTPAGRLRALWYTTDLLTSGRYGEEELWTFGKVIGRLADEIEATARAQLSRRLARLEHAPLNVIHQLAFDDSIEVAGPILRESKRLDSEFLIANAKSKSQQHLVAIAERGFIEPPVTDVLVTLGNRGVIGTVANNNGARLSEFGFSQLINRAESDAALAETLGLRRDIPKQFYARLIAMASAEVKARLAAERPDLIDQIGSVVADIADPMQSTVAPPPKNYLAAQRVVAKQHQQGLLTQKSIAGFAQMHRVDEAIVGLSLLSEFPSDVVERVLFDKNRLMLLMLTRSLDFSWDTTISLLFLCASGRRISALSLDVYKNDFERLDAVTSRDVLRSYASRRRPLRLLAETERRPALPMR